VKLRALALRRAAIAGDDGRRHLDRGALSAKVLVGKGASRGAVSFRFRGIRDCDPTTATYPKSAACHSTFPLACAYDAKGARVSVPTVSALAPEETEAELNGATTYLEWFTSIA
jgi:hypothetical protein